MGWLLAPYAFAPLVLSVLLGRNHGLYAAFFVSFWSSVLFVKIDAPLLVISLISGFTAVYLTLQVRRRSKLIRAGLGVGVAIWLASLCFGLITINFFPPTDNDWGMIGIQSALALGNGIVTAMIVGGALPLLEHLFQITTDVSWLELSDLNHPLLRRMTIEAPGHLSSQSGGREFGRSRRGSDRRECDALPRLCVFPRRRQIGEAGILHREHELRAQPAR